MSQEPQSQSPMQTIALNLPEHIIQTLESRWEGQSLQASLAAIIMDHYRTEVPEHTRKDVGAAVAVRQACQAGTPWAFSVMRCVDDEGGVSYYRSQTCLRPLDYLEPLATQAGYNMSPTVKGINVHLLHGDQWQYIQPEFFRRAVEEGADHGVTCAVELDFQDMTFSYTYPGAGELRRMNLDGAVRTALDVFLHSQPGDHDLSFLTMISEQVERLETETLFRETEQGQGMEM